MSRTLTRRHITTRAGAALGVGALAAACGPNPRNGQQTGSGASGPVSLVLWDRHEAGYPAFMDVWLPIFNQKYAGKIGLQWESRTSEWETKLTTTIVAGTPPDVAAVFGTAFRNLQESKQALALDAFIKASQFDANDFVPGIYKAMNIQGQQVGLPQYINTNTVYYNKDTLTRLGVPFPPESWTQDQFLDTAQKLSRGPSSQRETWGIDLPLDSITTHIISLSWGAGAQYNDPRNGDVFTLNTPQNSKAVQWAHDIFWRHRVGAKNNDDRGGVGRSEAVFVKGNVAMMIEGTHLLAEWKTRAQADWDVAPLPKGPAGKGERLSMDGYIMPVGIKTTDASWTAMQEITSKESNKIRAELLGFVPARKSQFDVWTNSIPGKRLKHALASDEARVDPGSIWPRARDVAGAINPIWRKLFVDNELNVQDALKQMQDAVAGVLGPSGTR